MTHGKNSTSSYSALNKWKNTQHPANPAFYSFASSVINPHKTVKGSKLSSNITVLPYQPKNDPAAVNSFNHFNHFPNSRTIFTKVTNPGAVALVKASNEVINWRARSRKEFDKRQKIDIANVKLENNILNNFENYTYNLKVFLVRESASITSMEKEDIIVLAESGATDGFNIEECILENIISPNFITQNTLVFNVQLKITEPLGSSFFDKIRIAAQSLGIHDHTLTPWWIELTFKGYNGPGEDSYTGGDNILRTESRLYRLTVQATTAEVTSGGTTYDIKLAPTDEIALRDQFRRLNNTITIEADTIGNFLEKLEKLVSISDKYTAENLKNNEYPAFNDVSFVAPYPGNPGSDMFNWKLRGDNKFLSARAASFSKSDKQKNKDSGVTVTQSKTGITTVSFHKGTAVEALIQQLISTTVEGQSLAILGEKTGSNVFQKLIKGRHPNTPAVIFIIDPTVIILSYNDIAKNYNIKTRFNIRSYLTFQPMVSADQIAIAEVDKKRLITMMQITNIKKHYEYIYTGLNTEIIDFKLSFDKSWFIQLPIFSGKDNAGPTSGTAHSIKTATNGITGTTTTDSTNNPSSTKKPVTKLFNNITINQIGSKSKVVPLATTTGAILLNKLNSHNISKISTTNNIKINTTAFSASTLLTTSNNITRFIDINGKQPIIQPIVNPKSSKLNRGTIYYAEDLSNISTNRQESSAQKKLDPNKEVRGILKSDNIVTEDVDQINIESTAGPGRTFFSAILNQVYGKMADLITVNIEIRGDPYWLGDPNVNKRVQSNVPSKDLTSSQSLFLFTMGFPETNNDLINGSNADSFAGTGITNINRSQNGFNGIYQVRQVKSIFSNGKFTQHLDAFIDPLTREQEVIKLANFFKVK